MASPYLRTPGKGGSGVAEIPVDTIAQRDAAVFRAKLQDLQIVRVANAVGDDPTVVDVAKPSARYQYRKDTDTFQKITEEEDLRLTDLNYSNPAYPALTNQQEVNDELLYFNPTVSVLINGAGAITIEKPLNPLTINLKWTANKSVISAIANGVEQLTAPANTQTLNGFQNIASSLAAGAQTFSFGVTVNDGKNSANQTRYARLVYPFYAGLAAAKPATAADVQALTKYVKTKSSTTINIPAATPQFPVVAYPAIYGNISRVLYTQGFNSDVISAHDALYDIPNVPMADGSVQTYRVIVATEALAFSETATYNYHF